MVGVATWMLAEVGAARRMVAKLTKDPAGALGAGGSRCSECQWRPSGHDSRSDYRRHRCS